MNLIDELDGERPQGRNRGWNVVRKQIIEKSTKVIEGFVIS